MAQNKARIKYLERQVETLRERMVQNGLSKGLTHPDTVEVSQELDKVLNKLQTLKNNG